MRRIPVRTLFSLLSGLTAATAVQAQDSATATATVQSRASARPDIERRKKVSVGPVAGVNFAKWGGDDVGEGQTSRTGFHGGLLLTAELGRHFDVQTGAIYSQEGTGADFSGGISATFKVNYVRVPLLLKARAPLSGSRLVPYAVLGPSLAFKASCDIEVTDGQQTVSRECDDPEIGLDVTTVDLGMVLGVGFDFGKFTAGFRYVPGLRSIDGSNDGSADVHNSLLAITAGYAF